MGRAAATTSGAPRPAARELFDVLDGLELDELRSRQAAATADIQTMGITFTVYSDGRGIDRAWPFDVIPRVIEATEWARIDRGLGAAPRRPQSLHRRRLQRPAGHRRRRVPRRAARRLGQLPPRVPGRSPALRRVGAHLRVRPRPRRRRHDVRARGQPAGAVRASATCWRTGRSASGRSPRCSPARRIAPVDSYTEELSKLLVSLAPDERRQPERRRAHAGHLQLGLLRALVPRPADGRHARRGQRPRRVGRRPCVHAHDRRPRAGRRDLPPHRRPVPRPRGVPARLACSACPG